MEGRQRDSRRRGARGGRADGDSGTGRIDVEYVTLKSGVTADNQGKVSTVRLDPWLPGVGVGYRFRFESESAAGLIPL
jgi:OmpW family